MHSMTPCKRKRNGSFLMKQSRTSCTNVDRQFWQEIVQQRSQILGHIQKVHNTEHCVHCSRFMQNFIIATEDDHLIELHTQQ